MPASPYKLAYVPWLILRSSSARQRISTALDQAKAGGLLFHRLPAKVDRQVEGRLGPYRRARAFYQAAGASLQTRACSSTRPIAASLLVRFAHRRSALAPSSMLDVAVVLFLRSLHTAVLP